MARLKGESLGNRVGAENAGYGRRELCIPGAPFSHYVSVLFFFNCGLILKEVIRRSFRKRFVTLRVAISVVITRPNYSSLIDLQRRFR